MKRSRIWALAFAGLTIWTLVEPCALRGRDQPTVEELKARVAATDVAGRPPLCLRIAERQLDAASKFYAAGEGDKARAALTDVVAFAALDREYAIQSHKHEKQSEIAIRKMVRKLSDLKHTLTHDEQEQVQTTIDELQRVRDDLLAAMFPKGVKK
jgi:hypothetical protein